MKTKEFLKLLNGNPEKELIFEYLGGTIPKAYHITEIKSAHINSVDCGGHSHTYDETVVQLWISGNEQKDQYMLAKKAAQIFQIVDQKRPLLPDTPIFFEYGDQQTPTSVYIVDGIENEEGYLKVKMSVPATVCKPRLALNVIANVASEVTGCCGDGKSACC